MSRILTRRQVSIKMVMQNFGRQDTTAIGLATLLEQRWLRDVNLSIMAAVVPRIHRR